MPINADSYVIELEARTAAFDNATRTSAKVFDQSAGQIERSAVHAEGVVRRSNESAAASTALVAQRTRLLGYQIADVGTQLASGTNPFIIIAQQAPQVANALEGTVGVAGRLAAFFSGPWGAALLAAGSVVGVLISKMHDSEDAMAGAAKGADAHRTAAEALTDAIVELDKITGKNIVSEEDQRVSAVLTAKARLDEAVATRNAAAAQLEYARSLASVQLIRAQGPGQLGEIATLGVQTAQGNVTALENRIAALDKSIAGARSSIGFATGNFASRYAKQVEDRPSSARGGGRSSSPVARVGHDADDAAIKVQNLDSLLDKLWATIKSPEDVQRERDKGLFSLFGNDPARDFDNIISNIDKAADAELDARSKANEELKKQQETDIKDLADLYESAFLGGNGSIWDSFKREGIRAVAEVLAKLTVAKAGGSIAGLGATISGLIGLDSGGSFMVGGHGGVDRHVLSIDGRPRVRVSGNEQITVSRPGQADQLAPAQPSLTIIAPQQFDLRGVVMTSHLVRQMDSRNRHYADQVAVAASQAAYKNSPLRIQQLQTDGT